MCRGEIIVVGEVLGVSQCLDSVAGGIAVKLVNPAGLGISSAGGVRRSRGLKESVAAPQHLYAVPLRKPTPRRCLIQYDEADLPSNKRSEIGKRAQQLVCSLLL